MLLSMAYHNSLKLASENHVSDIAFPNISTGIYCFPKKKAAQIAIDTVGKFMANPGSSQKVIFVCYDQENYEIYNEMLQKNI